MRLNELKKLKDTSIDLTEGVIPVHLQMTLEKVIRDGKISDNVQTFIMAGLIDMFKSGGPLRYPRDINAYGASNWGTQSDMIEAVRGLQPTEQSQIASWLLERLLDIGNYESKPRENSDISITDWINLVVNKSDN